MATPLTYDQLKSLLIAEGLKVKEVAGSRDRCRCHAGSHAKGGPKIRTWGSINGVMVHITAGNLGGRTPAQYIASIINGDASLPDKVQFVTDPEGVVYINSAGRSNHAGEISQTSLTHSIDADWPLDKWTDHRGSGVDGNAHFYGIENIAASSMTSAQRKATVSICAAIARHYGWTGRETVGHGECSSARGYADPGLNTGTLRKDVMAQVKSKPGSKPTPSPKPAPKAQPLRVGTLNFPDKTKITVATEAARIKRAVAQINAANLDIIGIQEGVGRVSATKPSSLMAALVKALPDYALIIPTLDLNENYFLHRKGIAFVQHPDVVIRGVVGKTPIGGRHVSLATFDTTIGKVTVGNTQLVNDNRRGAEVQAGLSQQALKDAAADGKAILMGDLNTSGPLTALTTSGLKNARVVAKAAGNRDAVTYTNQTKTKPSTDPEWLIDWIWVSPSITVNGYTVVQDLDSKGNFVKPRVSDHSLTIVSLS